MTPNGPVPEGEAVGAEGLVDWRAAFETAAELTARGDRLRRALAESEAASPVFRNRDFPLSPLPLFVRGEAAGRVIPRLEAYVALLEKVMRLYGEHEEVRRWYGLDAAAEALIGAEREAGREAGVRVCRLDGYLRRGSERLRLLENNADAPAGTLFTPRVHSVVTGVLNREGIAVPPHSPEAVPDESALLSVLTGGDARDRPATLVILQPRGAENRESREMVHAFQASGVEVFVADPREISAAGSEARLGGRRVDACWNKINTVGWNRLLRESPALLERWAAVLRDTDLVHVNSFLARYVAENKLSLAFVQEPEFSELFEERERRLAGELLPWSRRLRLGAGMTDEVLDGQHRYVLKRAYDIRGDGVTVGWAVSRSVWAKAMAAASKEPLVVQEYVAPTAYPVIQPGGAGTAVEAVAMPTSFDAYLLRGRLAFFGSKAGLHPRLNVFQGGRKLAVHVVRGRREND